MIHLPLLFIGGGTMARAIITGAIEAGVVSPARVAAVDPSESARAALPDGLGHITATIDDGYRWLAHHDRPAERGQIILAVKPQSLADVAASLRPLLVEPRVVTSILAGAAISAIGTALGPHARIIRVMPNTPARIRLGMSAIAVGPGATAADAAPTRDLFASLGRIVEIDESLMDAFTALAGSGPAYVFTLAAAMRRAGESLGFSSDVADVIVRQTLLGSASLLAQSSESAEELAQAVTSKGGTTEAALKVLREAGFEAMMNRAITAARDRGRGLGG